MRLVLVHGLWMGPQALALLGRRLARAGHAVERVGYASVRDGADAAAEALAARLRDQGPVALVGHSLGGLVALAVARKLAPGTVERIVCLGSPLGGSAVASKLACHRLGRHLVGASAQRLCEGVRDWDARCPVGVVAGVAPYGLGRVIARFEAEHDGTVALAETRFPGAAHCTVPTTHTGLLFSKAAAERVHAFLARGRFD